MATGHTDVASASSSAAESPVRRLSLLVTSPWPVAAAGLGAAMALHRLVPQVGVLTWAVGLGVVLANVGLLRGVELARITKKLLRVGVVLLGFSVSLASVAALGRIRADVRKLFPSERKGDYFSVHVFACDSGEIALRSRHFADFNGLIEDPFTGSASGGMAAYCARYGLVKAASYAIAQGDHAGRPGVGYIRVLGTPDAIEGIEVGGEAVTVLRGTLVL